MRALARAGALVLILAVAALAQPATPTPPASPSPAAPAVSAPSTSAEEQPVQPGRRNLFLAPSRVREAQTGRAAQGQAPAAVPSVPLPPPPGLLLPPPLPGTPVPPGTQPEPQQELAPPELVGVLAGESPQAILRSGADVAVVARGDRTAWGVVEAIRPDAVVLRTPKGKLTLRVTLEGVQTK